MAQEKSYAIIVDDDEDDRNLLRDAFLETGFPDQFRMFDNGVKLMQYLEEIPPAPLFIIIDLHMPMKSGREIVREIKTNPQFKAIPIISLSTGLSSQTRIEMLELGTNCVIAKPNSFVEILEVARCIGLVFNF